MKRILIALFIISFLTRLFFLIWGHPSLTHDEADFFYNGYLISKTNSDVFGNKVFFTTGILSAAPNVPNYLSSLGWSILQNKDVVFARLPFAILNSFTPVIFASIIYALSSKIVFSIIAFSIFNFSPWFLNISVTAGFDSPLGLLFILLSILNLITLRGALRLILFFLFNFLAFNSYMGFRIISPFIMAFQIYFFILSNKRRKKGEMALNIVKSFSLAVLLFIIFLIPVQILPNTSHFQSRAFNDIIFTNKDIVGNEIWYANYTTSSELVGRVFANKIFTPTALFLKKWLHTFDITSIFAGETHPIYGMRISGLFYLTDIFLFILGIIVFSLVYPSKLKFLILIYTFAGLPFAINPQGVTIALRGIFLIIPYTLLVANGYWYLYLKHKKMFILASILFVLNVISLSLLYVYRIRVISSEAFHATDKKVIQRLTTLQERVHIFPYEYRPFVLLHGFYSDENPNVVKLALQDNTTSPFISSKYNSIFHKECDDYNNIESGSLVVVHSQKCSELLKTGEINVIQTFSSQEMSGQVLFTLGRKK